MTETETAGAETEPVHSRFGSVVRKLGLRAFAERLELADRVRRRVRIFPIAKTDIFLSWNNFQAILDDASVLSVLAVGVTVVLVIGEFDLSVGTVIGMTAAASVAAMSYKGAPAAVAILIALGAGALAGSANGIAVAFVRIPSFIATLAIGSIAGGIELAITKSSIFEGLDPRFLEIATIHVGGFSLRTIIAIGLALAFLVILRTTVFGRNASAIGDNPAAARLTGVPVQRVKVIVFMLTGLTAGLAAILAASSAQSYYTANGDRLPPARVCRGISRSLARRRTAVQRDRQLHRRPAAWHGHDGAHNHEPAELDRRPRPGRRAARSRGGDRPPAPGDAWPLSSAPPGSSRAG